jgi:hypothetical protein
MNKEIGQVCVPSSILRRWVNGVWHNWAPRCSICPGELILGPTSSSAQASTERGGPLDVLLDQRLILASLIEHFFVTDLIHDLVPLDGFLLRDTNKLLLECARTVRCIEIEKSFRLVHAEKVATSW